MIPTTRPARPGTEPVPAPARLAASLARPSARTPATPTVADLLDRLADLVAHDGEPDPDALAALVALLARAAADVGATAPPAPRAGDPVALSLRTAGVLAARTAGRQIPLDPGAAAQAEWLWASVEGRPVPAVAPAARPRPPPPDRPATPHGPSSSR